MKVAIYGRPGNKKINAVVHELFESLSKYEISRVVNEPLYNYLIGEKIIAKKPADNTFTRHDEIKNDVDFVFSIGGDGTLLDTVSLVRDTGIPILGINTGRLGFLAGVPKDNFEKSLECLLQGHFSLDKRSLVRLESSNSLFGDVSYALNELTIHKKDRASMITIHAYLNGEFLNSYWADGLIIATPTGSTGYSLSCGGPIIAPQSENFVITPVAPHNLHVRPMVVSDKNVISLETEGRNKEDNFLVTLDTRSVTIDSSIQLAARKEDFFVYLVRLNNENFLSTLRNKLMWGADNRN